MVKLWYKKYDSNTQDSDRKGLMYKSDLIKNYVLVKNHDFIYFVFTLLKMFQVKYNI